MYTPNHHAEDRLLKRRREMEERLGTYSAAGNFRSRNPKLYLWPTTPQLVEWASGATAANRTGAFSRERLLRAGRSGLDAQNGGLRPDGIAAGGRGRALSAQSASSAGSADSNRTRQSRSALSYRAARGLRATLWPLVEEEVRWLQVNFENDMRVTRMDFAEHYNKMQNGLLNVSDQVTGLQRAVEEYTARVGGGYGGDAPGDRPVRFPTPVPNIFDRPPRPTTGNQQDGVGSDRLSVPGPSSRTPSPRMPGRYPRTSSDSTRTPSPELSRARPAHSTAPPTDTRRLDPRRATVEPEGEGGEEDAANGSNNGRRPSDYYQTAAEEWEERRTLMSNAQQRNPFREPDQPPSPATPRPEHVAYPRLPTINLQLPSPQDRQDHAMSGTQGGREHVVVSGGLGLHVPMPNEDSHCWRYWPKEARPPPPPRPPKEALTGQGPPKLPLTPEESGSSTPAEEEQTPEERIIACYNGLRHAVWRFCDSSRLINLGPCKNGLHQNIMGTRQFPFETSFPDAKAEGARQHIMLPLPAVDPERWNEYSKDQRWWIIWSGIMEVLWDMILSDRGMKEILYPWRNHWQEYCALVTDSIYYALKPVWNQWVLDDEDEVGRIKEEIWEIVEVAHWLKWLTKNFYGDGDGDGQEATTKERFLLFVPEADLVEQLDAREWHNIFQLRGELDGMRDSMGENTRLLQQQLQTTEELNLITGNPLYMFAFPALLKGMANQKTLQWTDERVLERGWVIGKTLPTDSSPPARAVPVAAAAPAAAPPTKTGLAAAVAKTLAAAASHGAALASSTQATVSAATRRSVDRWDDGEGNVGEYSSCAWEPVEKEDLVWEEDEEKVKRNRHGKGSKKGKETDTDWEEVGRDLEQREAEDEAYLQRAEARERELARHKVMAKRLAVEDEKRKKGKERREREEKESEKQEREEALAKRQREEKAAEVKREIRKGKKKEKKAKQKTVAQIAAENAARQRRNST